MLSAAREADADKIPGKVNKSGSSFKRVLLRTNAQQDRMLNTEIEKIERLRQKHFKHVLQERKVFLIKKTQLPDPSILVERAPSPDAFYKAALDKYDKTNFDDKTPNYMRPLERRAKTPSTFMTIDAFTVRQKRKVNVWEEKDKNLIFHSVAPPSNPLNEEELHELQRAWQYHHPHYDVSKSRPTTRAKSMTRDPRPKSEGQKGDGCTYKSPKSPRKGRKIKKRIETTPTFITEMPQIPATEQKSKAVRVRREHTPTSGSSKIRPELKTLLAPRRASQPGLHIPRARQPGLHIPHSNTDEGDHTFNKEEIYQWIKQSYEFL